MPQSDAVVVSRLELKRKFVKGLFLKNYKICKLF